MDRSIRNCLDDSDAKRFIWWIVSQAQEFAKGWHPGPEIYAKWGAENHAAKILARIRQADPEGELRLRQFARSEEKSEENESALNDAPNDDDSD